LANVSDNNFDDLTLPLPIKLWEDINSLQIMINTLPSDTELPKVFLDVVWVEVEYEDPKKEYLKNKLKEEVISDAFLDKYISKKSESTESKALNEIIKKHIDINIEGGFVYFLGDIDKDGKNDFALPEIDYQIVSHNPGDLGSPSFEEIHLITIYSSSTSQPFKHHVLEGRYPGVVSTLDDINDDEVSDYVILDPGFSSGEGGAIANERGKLTAYSGIDHSVLWTYTGTVDYQFQTGNAEMLLLAEGDHDGDGKDDLIVGAPGIKPYGALLILSSRTGAVLKEIQGDKDSGGIGYAFNVGPDLNNDGFGEILIGERYKDVNNFIDAGQVRMISGKDFSTRFKVKGNPQRYGFFGIFVSFIDDFNGDGIQDILVESREDESNNKGIIYILSSVDGATIFKFIDPETYEKFRNIFLVR